MWRTHENPPYRFEREKPWVFHSNWSLAPARGAQQQCVIMAADGDNELGTFDHLGGFFQA